MTSDIPTIKEELERKSIEVLVRVAEQLRGGRIERRAACVAASTVWDVVSGLVDSSITQLAEQLVKENPAHGWKRYFVGNDATKLPLVLVVVPGRAYVLQKINPVDGERTVLKKRELEPGDLEEEVATLVDRLKLGGYIEL